MTALWRGWRGAAIVAVAVAAAYANVPGNGWHYDDVHAITENPHLRSLADPVRFLSDRTQFSRDADKAMFRPLLVLTFALNYAWSGLQTWSWHLVNIGLHVGCSLLLWRILRGLGRGAGLALFGALAFGLHPLATEPVNYVSSRSELLAALFVLAAFLGHQLAARAGDRPWRAHTWRALSVLAYALAVLAKEVALATPLLLLAHDALRPEWRRRAWRPWAPYAVVAALYLAIVAGHLLHAVAGDPVRGPGAQLATQAKAVPYYARLLAFPVGLNVHHQFFAGGAPVLLALALAAVLSLAVVVARHAPRDVVLGSLWMALIMAPTVLVPLHVLVNDHRLYLPLAGAVIALTALAPSPRRAGTTGLAVAVLAALAVSTWQRNRVWADEYTLWTDAAAKSPHPLVPVAYVHLGNYAKEHGANEEAVSWFRRALEIAPDHVAARVNLGTALQRLGRVEEAIATFQGVVAEHPEVAEGWHNLGKAWQEQGDGRRALGDMAGAAQAYAAARQAYARVAPDSYHYDLALNNLGATFEHEGRVDSAAHYYRLALGHRADSPDAATNVARLLAQLPARADAMIREGRAGELESLCAELLAARPSERDALFFLAVSRFVQGRCGDSVAPNRELVARHPGFAEGYLQLGNAYETLGDPARAGQVYRKQLQHVPDGALADEARRRLRRLEPGAGAP